jgi:hypothetical protein
MRFKKRVAHSLIKTKQGILADALLLCESAKIRRALLREIITRIRVRFVIGGGTKGLL